jgi:hypothetical protein
MGITGILFEHSWAPDDGKNEDDRFDRMMAGPFLDHRGRRACVDYVSASSTYTCIGSGGRLTWCQEVPCS